MQRCALVSVHSHCTAQPILSLTLRQESSRITREHTALPNVGQTKIKHHHSLHSNSSASMRESTITECIQIGRNGFQINSPRFGTFLKESSFVNTLSPRQDLLSTDEDVVTVWEFGVLYVLIAMRKMVRRVNQCKMEMPYSWYLRLGQAWCRKDGPKEDTCPWCKSQCCTSPSQCHRASFHSQYSSRHGPPDQLRLPSTNGSP